MDNNPIDSWSQYLAGQLQQQYGMTERQAKETVVRWLKSLRTGRRRFSRNNWHRGSVFILIESSLELFSPAALTRE